MPFLTATMLGLITGLAGTLVGGLLIIYSTRRSSMELQGSLLGFSGGIMTMVVLFDLWPEAWHFGGAIPTVLGTFLGFLLVRYFDTFLAAIPWYHERQFSRFAKVGILLGVGIGIHNFPEGVALGTTYITNPALQHWIGLALLMAIHNIPEGMAVASAFRFGNVQTYKIMTALFLVEIPMAFGGTVGAILGRISNQAVALSLGFAGGAMVLLVIQELLPMAKKISGAIWIGAGFLIGSLLGILLVQLI